jgi:hypothetical protein
VEARARELHIDLVTSLAKAGAPGVMDPPARGGSFQRPARPGGGGVPGRETGPRPFGPGLVRVGARSWARRGRSEIRGIRHFCIVAVAGGAHEVQGYRGFTRRNLRGPIKAVYLSSASCRLLRCSAVGFPSPRARHHSAPPGRGGAEPPDKAGWSVDNGQRHDLIRLQPRVGPWPAARRRWVQPDGLPKARLEEQRRLHGTVSRWGQGWSSSTTGLIAVNAARRPLETGRPRGAGGGVLQGPGARALLEIAGASSRDEWPRRRAGSVAQARPPPRGDRAPPGALGSPPGVVSSRRPDPLMRAQKVAAWANWPEAGPRDQNPLTPISSRPSGPQGLPEVGSRSKILTECSGRSSSEVRPSRPVDEFAEFAHLPPPGTAPASLHGVIDRRCRSTTGSTQECGSIGAGRLPPPLDFDR